MKKAIRQLMIFLACVATLVGCSKQKGAEASKPGKPDLAVLRQKIPSPTPDVAAVLDRLNEQLTYEPGIALKDLAALANHPSLNDAQKQAVTDFREQFRTFLASRKPAP